MNQRIVIVGAGLAAYAAATALRKADPDITLTIVGDEPYAPYDRPPLSKAVMQSPDAGVPWLLPPQVYAERNIALLTGRPAIRIDRREKTVALADGETVPYDTLILATGGSARRLDVPGGAAIRALRTYDDAIAIRSALVPGAALVCLGAGVISLELAAVAAERGVNVHVVEAGSTVMARLLPEPERAFLLALHRHHGTQFMFGDTIAAVETAGGFHKVHLGSGTTLAADLVVAGIGMLPNTALAREAGLDVSTGILTDALGRTSDPHIFAMGDVAEFFHPGLARHVLLESWYNAMDQAAAIARTLTGTETPHAPVPRFWTDQFGRNFQAAGNFAAATRVVVEGERGPDKFTALYLDDRDRVVFAMAADDPRRLRAALKSIAAGAVYEGEARPQSLPA